jgi:hypothetical protein
VQAAVYFLGGAVEWAVMVKELRSFPPEAQKSTAPEARGDWTAAERPVGFRCGIFFRWHEFKIIYAFWRKSLRGEFMSGVFGSIKNFGSKISGMFTGGKHKHEKLESGRKSDQIAAGPVQQFVGSTLDRHGGVTFRWRYNSSTFQVPWFSTWRSGRGSETN